MEIVLITLLMLLGLYIIKTTLATVIKIGICLFIISMILNILLQRGEQPMKEIIIYLDNNKKTKKIMKIKRFVNKIKKLINKIK